MNWVFLILGLVMIHSVVCQIYTDRYDDINVDEILQNRRLLGGYVKCILDKGRCTPEGKELKSHFLDGMRTACSKCTDAQKKMARKAVKHIRFYEQEYWDQIKNKYDPTDKYKDIYEQFLAEED